MRLIRTLIAGRVTPVSGERFSNDLLVAILWIIVGA